MKEITRVIFTPLIQERKKVAAYCRVSTGKDAMLHSLAAQVDYYKNMIESNAMWQFSGIYYDEALTGTKADRDGFQKMLTECKNGNIDMVITKSISRFARNTVTLLENVHRLKCLGIDVFFEEQNIHSNSPDGELMLTLLAGIAQEESLSASENQKWRVKRAFENGELINFRFMFGYNIEKGKVEINEEQAVIVKEIFERAINGDSLCSIARSLEERNIPCVLGGNNWNPIYIKKILSNEKYTGNALLGKSFRNNHIEKKKTRNIGQKPMYFAEGTHTAIIGAETFSRAQEIVKVLNSKEYAKHETTILTGKVLCGHCGGKHKRRTTKTGKSWNCRTYVEKGKTFCPGCSIKEDLLLEIAESVGDFESVTVYEGILVFSLENGKDIEVPWRRQSRKDSWTEEKRLRAAQHGKKRWEVA